MIVRILIVAAIILSSTHALSMTMIEYIFLNPAISFTPPAVTTYVGTGKTVAETFQDVECHVSVLASDNCGQSTTAVSAQTLSFPYHLAAQVEPPPLTEIISQTAQEVLKKYPTPYAFGEAIQASQLAFIEADPDIGTHSVTYYLPVIMPPVDSGELIDGYVIYSLVIENGNNTLLVSAHQIAYDEPLNGAMALFLFPTNMLPDTDNDGVVDSMDNCPFDADNDMDDDGICGDEDNCPADANVDQANFDDDVFGNVCDADDDNDGFDDEFDNCQYDNNPSQSDIDIDGIGDVCDSDIDGDNVIDAIDECIDTTFGDVVNETGCSIQQICPCDNNWKNHGGYMKCVAHTSEYFLDYGLITFDEKDIIVSSEAKTKCGSKK